MYVVITGSRGWTDKTIIYNSLYLARMELGDFTLLEGGAKGADALGRLCAEELGLEFKTIKAEWKKYGRGAGAVRNRVMVDMEPRLVLGFALNDSPGTSDCVMYARGKKIETRVMYRYE